MSGEDEAEPHDEEPWLVSYADMMTLLFGFFVILYSFAQAKLDKVPEEMLDDSYVMMRKETAKYFGSDDIDPLKKVEEQLKNKVDTSTGKLMDIKVFPEGMEISFQSQAIFESGSASLKPKPKEVLALLADQILAEKKEYKVVVEGHTDDVPISDPKGRYPSNWELSSARASSVIRLMQEKGFPPKRLLAQGFGASHPLVPNRDEKGAPISENQAKNRRVKVKVLMVSDYVLQQEKTPQK